MPIKSKRLQIVGRQEDTGSLSAEFQEALAQWKFLEGRLEGLIQKQDAEISADSPDVARINELQSVIAEVEQEQSQLIAEIARRPCTNLHDVAVKLQLWQGVNHAGENEWASPSDRLVTSALDDLISSFLEA